jgi:hypothetical protein
VVTYRGLRRLWQPPADTLESIAAALGEHWRSAANSRPAKLFGTTSRNWLRVALNMNVVSPPTVTISPQAAGSSDTPRDPRPY